MIFAEFLVSLITAALLTGLYRLLTRGSGPRKGLAWLFLTIFLATWAGGVWLRPMGPPLWGVHWLTFFLAGLIMALVFIAFMPPGPPAGREETLEMLEDMEQEKELTEVTYVTLSIFFWVLLLVFVMAILLRYLAGIDLGPSPP